MADYSLVPVDHRPEFDHSLIPVDYDPFGGDVNAALAPQTAPTAATGPMAYVQKALEPITSYPETYSRVNRESWDEVSRGIDQLEHPAGGVDVAKGIGNVALGSLGFVGSPVNAAIDTVVGKPIEEITGIPSKYTDFAASMALPIPKFLPHPGAGRAAAVPAEASALRGGADSLESRSASIYNPPAKPPRPFEADYPSGAPADVRGNLVRDIEGRNLTAENIVGRRTLGGADEALTPAELDAAAAAILGNVPESVPASALPRNSVGAYRNARGPDGPQRRIAVLESLNEAARAKVAAHEFGHAIDDLAGEIDAEPLTDELRRVYNTLINPNRGTAPGTGRYGPQTGEAARGRIYTPEDAGYRGDDVSPEYMAEALRAYMADPNYLKTVAPRTAAAIRKFVNDNPRLNKIIQFNGVAAPVGAGAMNGNPNDDR
jgi:hypothetical protein